MKTDANIQTDVIQELKWDPSINHELIGVIVENGIVTLSGKTPSYFEIFSAEKAAKRVSGVRAIVEKIEVDLPGSSIRDDGAIAQAVLNSFFWNVQIPEKGIQVKVEKGYVTLTGQVDWPFQRTAAEKVVKKITGVRGVSNFVTLTAQKAQPAVVKQKIEDALKRSAESEARKITVQVAGDKVILNGSVHSMAESEDAKWAAWCAMGVSTVENNLRVNP